MYNKIVKYMSLDNPPRNKMMESAPAKKDFHFPRTALHYAVNILAETIEEATKIYHEIKIPISSESAAEVSQASSPAPAEEITSEQPAPTEEKGEGEIA